MIRALLLCLTVGLGVSTVRTRWKSGAPKRWPGESAGAYRYRVMEAPLRRALRDQQADALADEGVSMGDDPYRREGLAA